MFIQAASNARLCEDADLHFLTAYRTPKNTPNVDWPGSRQEKKAKRALYRVVDSIDVDHSGQAVIGDGSVGKALGSHLIWFWVRVSAWKISALADDSSKVRLAGELLLNSDKLHQSMPKQHWHDTSLVETREAVTEEKHVSRHSPLIAIRYSAPQMDSLLSSV